MAHKIFGNRFLSRAEPAWHDLGRVFPADEPLFPSAAVREVTAGINITDEPLTYTLDGKAYTSTRRIVVRAPTTEDPEPMELGIVTGRWHLTDYATLAQSLDALDSNIYRVETAGLLSGGSLCFLALRGHDWSLLGEDEMRHYVAVTLSLEPGVGHKAVDTEVRVVCWNTLQMAIGGTAINLSISHDRTAAQMVKLCADLITRSREAHEETRRAFELMASTPAPKESVDAILTAAFPPPPAPKRLTLLKGVTDGDDTARALLLTPELAEAMADLEERHHQAKAREAEKREAGWSQFEAFEPTALRGTVWAAYQAATEVSDWRGDGERETAESVLIGSRAREKARAFVAAMDLMA